MEVRKALDSVYDCWSSSFPDGTKTPASRKEIEKSRKIFMEIRREAIEDEALRKEVDDLEKRFDAFYVRRFDGFYRAMIGSGIVVLYVLYVTIGIIMDHGFFTSATGISAAIILLWGVGGTILYYWANQAPGFLIDDLLADRMAGNKIAQAIGLGLDTVAQNTKPTTVTTRYSDGSTTTHVDYSNSAIAGLFPIVFRIVCKYIIPPTTAPFMTLKKILHNYVFYKNQKGGGVMASFLRFIGAM